MSFFGATWRVVQCVTSLGGTELIRFQQARRDELLREYALIRSRIADDNSTLITEIRRVRQKVRCARRTLRRAAMLLRRVRPGPGRPNGSAAVALYAQNSVTMARHSGFGTSFDADVATLAGAAAGTAAAATSWGVVQIIGHASTGAAMVGLHGAAASNAGWAWFGGGSLASGGGGMAAGHLILPGIGAAVAVTVSSVMSHKQANKLSKACDEIEQVNKKNELTLRSLGSHLTALRAYEDRLVQEHRILKETVTPVCATLLPFGILSHYWRIIRSWFTGCYFKREDTAPLEQLHSAVERFLSAFS